MNEITAAQMQKAAYAAYIDTVLFAIRFIFFFLPHSVAAQVQDGMLAGALLAIAEHLVLYPVIAALPAPSWGKAAGFGWLTIDMATDIMALNGVPATIFLTLRYGGHISACVWFASASWRAKGAILVVGLLYVLNLGSYSFLAAYGVSPLVLLPSSVLLPVWLILIGRRMTRLAHEGTAHADKSTMGGGAASRG